MVDECTCEVGLILVPLSVICCNIYCRLYIAFIGQFVLQCQGPQNLCCSVSNQMQINNGIDRVERKQCFKYIFMYVGENYGKCMHHYKLLISFVGRSQ
jgi:hypothetical protein